MIWKGILTFVSTLLLFREAMHTYFLVQAPIFSLVEINQKKGLREFNNY